MSRISWFAKRIVLNERNEIEKKLQTLHIQRKRWKGQKRNAIYYIFLCVNDDKEVDLGNLQVMRCLFCYNNPMHALNLNTKERKLLITYYKTYGISTLKKHVDNDHATIVKNLRKK
jgi:hypothetical protein